MASDDDEFDRFVMEELIDPSSSEDENDLLFFGAAYIIIEDSLNHLGRIGSVEGHEVVDRGRLFWHDLLYKDYFSDEPTFGPEIFRTRFACFVQLIIINFFLLRCVMSW